MKRSENKHKEMLVECSMASCTTEEVLSIFYGFSALLFYFFVVVSSILATIL
jgi:hypothetical protein